MVYVLQKRKPISSQFSLYKLHIISTISNPTIKILRRLKKTNLIFPNSRQEQQNEQMQVRLSLACCTHHLTLHSIELPQRNVSFVTKSVGFLFLFNFFPLLVFPALFDDAPECLGQLGLPVGGEKCPKAAYAFAFCCMEIFGAIGNGENSFDICFFFVIFHL